MPRSRPSHRRSPLLSTHTRRVLLPLGRPSTRSAEQTRCFRRVSRSCESSCRKAPRASWPTFARRLKRSWSRRVQWSRSVRLARSWCRLWRRCASSWWRRRGSSQRRHKPRLSRCVGRKPFWPMRGGRRTRSHTCLMSRVRRWRRGRRSWPQNCRRRPKRWPRSSRPARRRRA